MSKKKLKKIIIKKTILYVLLVFFLVVFIISGLKIINYIKDGNKNREIIEEISKDIAINNENDGYNIDFESLKAKNSDTVGFLKVNGTNVEQVVVKAQDNSFYLNHNFEKQINIAGWVFADYRNKFDDLDKNIIIYGHNMRNGTMFGSLQNILKKEWQENEQNRIIKFITENEEYNYEVFSVYQVEAEDYYIKDTFQQNEFASFVNELKSRSIYDFNVDVDEEDSIITLSTCGNNNRYRVVLHAKKMIQWKELTKDNHKSKCL